MEREVQSEISIPEGAGLAVDGIVPVARVLAQSLRQLIQALEDDVGLH